MFFDLPLEQLQTYLPPRHEPADFDSFWQQTLREACSFPLGAKFEPMEAGLALIEVYDVTFNGYGGQPINGWFYLPRSRPAVLPCLVEFIGYGGGRGLPHEWLLWVSAGYAHFVMDTRGQGSSWRSGDRPDREPERVETEVLLKTGEWEGQGEEWAPTDYRRPPAIADLPIPPSPPRARPRQLRSILFSCVQPIMLPEQPVKVWS